MNRELIALLEEALADSAKVLRGKAKSGEITSAEIKAAIALLHECGGSLKLPNGETHPVADEILDSLDDLDLGDQLPQ